MLKDESKHKVNPQIQHDINRHQLKLRKALREHIEEIIINMPVITGNEDKIVQIPIRGIQEFTFQFRNDGNAGRIVNGDSKKPGNKPGREMEDEDIRLQLAIELMLEDLDLLDLFRVLEEGDKVPRNLIRAWGKKRLGNRARMMKRETVKNKIARIRATKSKLPVFKPQDIRYRHFQPGKDGDYRAVVFFVLDISGSMDGRKLYLCRALYYCVIKYLQLLYSEVQIRFITHHADAEEKTEAMFFKTKSTGGTMLSSGVNKVLEIIEKEYEEEEWDIYTWHTTDGDNTSNDNGPLAEAFRKLCKISRAVLFCETEASNGTASQSDEIKKLEATVKNFLIFLMDRKEGIKDTLKAMLQGIKERSRVYEA